MANQLSDIEKAFHEARKEFTRTAEVTYRRLSEELRKLSDRANQSADDVRKLRDRLLAQAEDSARPVSKAAERHMGQLEKALAEARKELARILEDKDWVRNQLNEAKEFLVKATGAERALAAFEKEFAKRTGTTVGRKKKTAARKTAAKKRPATRKKAAKKRPATRKKAAAKKAAAKKKVTAKKRAAKKAPAKKASTKKTAAKKKAVRKKVAKKVAAAKKTSRKKAASKKKTTRASKKKT